MGKYSEEEMMAIQAMEIYCEKYEQTGNPDYLHKAKEIADNWWKNDSDEGKETAQKVIKLVYEQEQSM